MTCLGTRFAGAENGSRVLQVFRRGLGGRMRAAENAPRGPFGVLERRHCLADIVERGAGVLVKFAGIPDFKLDLPKVVSCKAERYKGTYAGCYSGNSRVAPRTHAIFDALPFVKQCRRRLERIVGDVHLFDLNATDLRVKDAPPPPRRPKKGPGDIRRDRAMHHLKKVGKKKGVPKE